MSRGLHWLVSGGLAAGMTTLSLVFMATINHPTSEPHEHEVVPRPPIELEVKPRPIPSLAASAAPATPLPQLDLPQLPIPNLDSPALPAFADDNPSFHRGGPSRIGLGRLDLGLAQENLNLQVDKPARAINRPAPRYPVAARRRGQEGQVTMRLAVDETGRVTKVVIVSSEPPGVFDAAAKAAVRGYRFAPARSQGEAVPSTLEQRVVFKLQ